MRHRKGGIKLINSRNHSLGCAKGPAGQGIPHPGARVRFTGPVAHGAVTVVRPGVRDQASSLAGPSPGQPPLEGGRRTWRVLRHPGARCGFDGVKQPRRG